jgi:hypothetical protein
MNYETYLIKYAIGARVARPLSMAQAGFRKVPSSFGERMQNIRTYFSPFRGASLPISATSDAMAGFQKVPLTSEHRTQRIGGFFNPSNRRWSSTPGSVARHESLHGLINLGRLDPEFAKRLPLPVRFAAGAERYFPRSIGPVANEAVAYALQHRSFPAQLRGGARFLTKYNPLYGRQMQSFGPGAYAFYQGSTMALPLAGAGLAGSIAAYYGTPYLANALRIRAEPETIQQVAQQAQPAEFTSTQPETMMRKREDESGLMWKRKSDLEGGQIGTVSQPLHYNERTVPLTADQRPRGRFRSPVDR